MARKPTTEEEPWWHDALKRFEECAAVGMTMTAACKVVSEEFGRGVDIYRNTIHRGSVPSFPSRYAEGARAWQAGEATYEGKPCKRHGTTTRYANDGICVTCMVEYAERVKAKCGDASSA